MQSRVASMTTLDKFDPSWTGRIRISTVICYASVESQGQVNEKDFVLPDLHGVVEDAARGEGRNAAVDDAFPVAGRARGEGHPHDVIGSQGLRHQRREGALAREPLVQRDGVGCTWAPEDTDRLQVGEMGTECLDHRDVLEAPERPRAYESTALREAQDILDLAAAEVGADRVRHRA